MCRRPTVDSVCSLICAVMIPKGVHAVFRWHQKQIVDFTLGRAHARPGQKRAPRGRRAAARRRGGSMDQVVEYS